jgi:hypothetical protein
MTSTTYIIANIKLLIEIAEDGNYQIHEDRTQIEFNPCDNLPPIRTNETNDMSKILSLVSSSTNKIKWNGGDNSNSPDHIQNTTSQEDNLELINEKEEEGEKEGEEEEEEEEEGEEEEGEEEEGEEEEREEEEELKVYKHELKKKTKMPSITTTLKNYHVKNNITKRQHT